MYVSVTGALRLLMGFEQAGGIHPGPPIHVLQMPPEGRHATQLPSGHLKAVTILVSAQKPLLTCFSHLSRLRGWLRPLRLTSPDSLHADLDVTSLDRASYVLDFQGGFEPPKPPNRRGEDDAIPGRHVTSAAHIDINTLVTLVYLAAALLRRASNWVPNWVQPSAGGALERPGG